MNFADFLANRTGNPPAPVFTPAPAGTAPPARAVGWRVGDRASFTGKTGRTITGTIIRINPKSVTLEQCDDGSRGWRVAPVMLHAPNTPAPVLTARASGWRVGDRASFTGKTGRTITGTITRVNVKSVTLEQCDDGSRGWRVAPGKLRAPIQ